MSTYFITTEMCSVVMIFSLSYASTPSSRCKDCDLRSKKFNPKASPCHLSQCSFSIENVEKGTSSGILIQDTIVFSNISSTKNVAFGCAFHVDDPVFESVADGVLGLGRGSLNILRENTFSLCVGAKNSGGGGLILEEVSLPSTMMFTSSNPTRSRYYNIDLREVWVGDEKLDISPSVFDIEYGTIINIGRLRTLFPTIVYDAFVEMLLTTTKTELVEMQSDDFLHLVCFRDFTREILFDSLPKVKLIMGGNASLEVQPENFIIRHPNIKELFCLDILENGDDPTTVIGVNFLRDNLVRSIFLNTGLDFMRSIAFLFSPKMPKVPNQPSPLVYW